MKDYKITIVIEQTTDDLEVLHSEASSMKLITYHPSNILLNTVLEAVTITRDAMLIAIERETPPPASWTEDNTNLPISN